MLIPVCYFLFSNYRYLLDVGISPNSCDRKPTISDDTGKVFQVHPLSVDTLTAKKIHTRVSQIVYTNNPLHEIDSSRCCTMAESFRNYKYDFVRGMMKVYFSNTVNLNGVTCTTAVHNVNGMKLLMDGYCTIMLNWLHHCCSVKISRSKRGVQ